MRIIIHRHSTQPHPHMARNHWSVRENVIDTSQNRQKIKTNLSWLTRLAAVKCKFLMEHLHHGAQLTMTLFDQDNNHERLLLTNSCLLHHCISFAKDFAPRILNRFSRLQRAHHFGFTTIRQCACHDTRFYYISLTRLKKSHWCQVGCICV